MIDEGLWIPLFLFEEGENKLAKPYPFSAVAVNYSKFRSIENFMMHSAFYFYEKMFETAKHCITKANTLALSNMETQDGICQWSLNNWVVKEMVYLYT